MMDQGLKEIVKAGAKTVFCILSCMQIFSSGISVSGQSEYENGKQENITSSSGISVSGQSEYENGMQEDLCAEVREAYVEVLNNNHNESGQAVFGLVYINDDDIPELFIADSASYLTEVDIYSYYNDESVKIGMVGSGGTCMVSPENNIIMTMTDGNSSKKYSFYTIKEGTVERTISFEEESYNIGNLYYIDYIGVDEEKYLPELDKMLCNYYIKIGTQAFTTYQLTEENIESFSSDWFQFLIE